MSLRTKAALALCAACLVLLGAFAGVAGAVWADLDAQERAALAALLEPHSVIVVLALAMACGALAFLAAPIVRVYLGGPARLAEQARLVLGANRAYRVRDAASAELDSLAQAFNELADQRDALHSDVERQVRESRTKLEEERNRLAALMAELAQGIVVCNRDGRILLYNNRARLLFSALGARGGGAAATLIGLGRSIFSVIERPLIEHALGNIGLRLAGGGQRAFANFVTASQAGQLIRVQMAPVLAAGSAQSAEPGPEVSGYVLLLENVTRSFDAESRRDEALHKLTEGSRATLANIRAAVETLTRYPDMAADQRGRFIGVIAEEVRASSERLDADAAQHADALKSRWVLEEMRGTDLLAAARTAIEASAAVRVSTDQVEPLLWVRADSFALIGALAHLAERLHREFGVREARLRLAGEDRLAVLDLAWPGSAAPLEALDAWEHQPMNRGTGSSPLTLHDVAQRHASEVWFGRDEARAASYCRLLLPIAQAQQEHLRDAGGAARPEYYDFALFAPGEHTHALDDRPLAALHYTVFDTETTGLAPDDGDEIIQVGAVRIVNLRVLHSETFDQLVDPRRRVSAASSKIHGITDDMLRGQPTIDEVLPALHAFCEDTVLVGHNAAFDMRFLQLKERSTGVRFEQPLLDTLLLSEVLHPAQESHRLEAIAQRLGVTVHARHSALGDALATAEVFVRIVGLLADAGIGTLREAREAAAKTRAAGVRY